MAYTRTNFKSKAALKRALKAGEQITCFQAGPFGGNLPANGTVALEGPHYPAPHTWYAEAVLKDGIVVKVS